jgi:hypothetical protein
MSLILRNNLTRPLTHDELDGNLVYLNIAEWVNKGYLEGQYVLIKTGTIGIIYYCEMTHTDFIYNQYGAGNFIQTYVDGSTAYRVWRQIGSSGGGGGAGYVTIQEEGIPLIERSVLNFVGGGVTVIDDPVNGRTIVTIDGSGVGEVTGGTTNATTGGTTNIIQTLEQTGGGTIVIDLVPAFTFENPNPVKKTVGGITTGTSPFVGGKTIHQIIQEIFYPAVAPTIFYSTVSLSEAAPFNAQLIEIGYTNNLTLNAVFSKGQSNVSGQPTKFMGNPIDYNYTGQGIIGTITNVNSGLTDSTTLNNYVVVQGLNQWQVATDYTTGEQPVFDTGENFNDGNFTNAGTVNANALFEGVYPLFATTSNINTLTKQPLVSMLYANNIEIILVAEPEDNSVKHKFEIPLAWTNNRSLVAVNYFNTVSNQFDTANKISEFSTSSVTNTIQGNVVNYTRYTHTGLAAGLRRIRLVF